LIGCLVGIAYSHGLFPRLSNARTLQRLEPAAIAVAFVVLFGFSSHSRQLYEGALPLFSLACAVVILTISSTRESPASRALSGSWLRYLGRISYGIYLWHAPLIAAVGPIGAVAAVPVAALSHRFVETPFLRRRHNQRPAPVTTAAPIAVEPAA